MKSKIPPQATDIEKATLGALIIDSNSLTVGMGKLFTDIFYRSAHQSIFNAITNVYDKGLQVDYLTVIEQLKKDNTLETAGGAYYITTLTNLVTDSTSIEGHIMILSEMYLKRKTIEVCQKAVNESFENSTDCFDIINQTDDSMQKMQERVLTGMAKDMLHYSMEMMRQHDDVKVSGILGISTGIKALDDAIAGLVQPDLIIIAARPGQGKTALALSITHHTSVLNNHPCAWFSLEMDGVQLVRRLAAIESGINHQVIRGGQTSTDEYKTLSKGIEKICKAPIYIEDRTSINIRDIRTRSNLLKKRHGIKYIVVDYLQLMSPVFRGQNREQEISEISRSLKNLAKELKIPVIALSQLSREVEKRPGKMPQLSDLRESGGIEQDADEVIFIMRPEYYGMTEDVKIGKTEYPVQNLAILKIDKNRHGEPTNIAVNFNGPTMHFYDQTTTDIKFNTNNWHKITNDIF